MSAWGWCECPKGCTSGKTKEVMRIDLGYGIDATNGAYVEMSFSCQVCDLSVKVGQTKRPKKIITEIAFD